MRAHVLVVEVNGFVMTKNPEESQKLLDLLQTKFGNKILKSKLTLGDAEIEINRTNLEDVFKLLKLDSQLDFNLLLSVTAVDYMDLEFMPRAEVERFELVYHLLSLSNLWRLRVKIAVPENSCEVHSITSIWPGAEFMEDEVWDMYGIKFTGHPDLRRILMYDEFKGFPLRKDYPLQGKQPRIPLIKPEVENTARLMHRPPLVQINSSKRSGSKAASAGGQR